MVCVLPSSDYDTQTEYHRLLRHRRICGSRACAEATALLLRRVVEDSEFRDASELMDNVLQAGQRLVKALPKELAVGNIVRRILGVIRVEVEEDREDTRKIHDKVYLQTHSPHSGSPPKERSATTLGIGFPELETTSRSNVDGRSAFGSAHQPHGNKSSSAVFPNLLSPGAAQLLPTNTLLNSNAAKDLKAEVVEGILEIIEELKQADEQIASYAVDHIHSNEIVLTHSPSETVRKFLLKAATRRKFTVIHAESYPAEHEATHTMVMADRYKTGEDRGPGHFQKSLSTAGISVILIPDSAIFAMMSRVNKVVLDAEAVFTNGGFLSATGSKLIAKAAQAHRTPMLVLSGVYKFSPVRPFNLDAFLEDGDSGKVLPYEAGAFMDNVNVENPLFEYVSADLVDLYLTNIGGHAPSYVYRIIADHYRSEDIHLDGLSPCQ